MKELTNRLTALMIEEEQNIRDFVRILDEEQSHLITFATEKLIENNTDKEECLARIDILEERRFSLLEEIAKSMRVDSGSLNITKIVSKLDPVSGLKLSSVRDRIASALSTVRSKIGENSEFINISEANATMALDFYQSLFKISSTYGKRGVSSYNSRNAGLVSSKA